MYQHHLSYLEDELSEPNRRKPRTAALSAVRQQLMPSDSLTTNETKGFQLEQQRQQVVVMQLELFQQVTQAVQILWQGHLLVLNLTQMDAIQAQRTVDFVAGANYSIDGQQQHLAPGLFLFAPKGVRLAKAVVDTVEL
ncbi:cell division protein SepF [Chroococcidiopsis cubana]|nr:cell division protein SepF [Chroococcidiopsis cubana]